MSLVRYSPNMYPSSTDGQWWIDGMRYSGAGDLDYLRDINAIHKFERRYNPFLSPCTVPNKAWSSLREQNFGYATKVVRVQSCSHHEQIA